MLQEISINSENRKLTNLSVLTTAMSSYLTQRGVDTRWTDSGLIPWNMTGFAPQNGLVYYSPASGIEKLWSDGLPGMKNSEMLNRAMEAHLWCIHDYLHIWCYSIMNEAMPELGIGNVDISSTNIEAMVYCHLLSEVCAVVGLDYWYLSNMDLANEVGVNLKLRTLSTTYNFEKLEDFRKVSPDFNPQSKSFFFDILHLFCYSEIIGADSARLNESSEFCKWAKHELKYSLLQREYTRLWLSHIGGFSMDYLQLSSPVDYSSGWKVELAKICSDALWDNLMGNTWNKHKILNSSWSGKTIDFRFTNICALDSSHIRKTMLSNKVYGLQAQMLGYQYLCQFDWDLMDPELRSKSVALIHKGKLPRLVSMLKDCSLYKFHDKAPLTLFLLN